MATRLPYESTTQIMNCLFKCKYCLVLVLPAIIFQIYIKTKLSVFVDRPEMHYDIVIVGAGTAGSVLTARLGENANLKVLLVEAGGPFGLLSKLPIAATFLQGGPGDWAYKSTPQKYSSFGLHNRAIPRGKGLGGSASINYMLQGIGDPDDFDNWHAIGATGWDYESFRPYLLRTIDHNRSMSSGNLTTIFEQAVTSANESEMVFKRAEAGIVNGYRYSILDSHLLPSFSFSKVHILLDATATKINFKGKRALSVEVTKDGQSYTISARSEVILSAGAIGTPKLLLLSGIGPESELLRYGINPIHLSSGVGMNLHDHLNMPIYVSINTTISVTVEKLISLKEIWQYVWRGKGILANTPVAGTASVGRHSALTLFAMGSVDEKLLREIANYRVEVFQQLFPYHSNSSKEGFVFLSTCLQPKSRGLVKLFDKDYVKPPIIDPNYLSDDWDVACMLEVQALQAALMAHDGSYLRHSGWFVSLPALWATVKLHPKLHVPRHKGIHAAVRLVKTPPFAKVAAKIEWPSFPECPKPRGGDDEINDTYLRCILRIVALTGHHLGGTCSMAGPNRVTDSQLRVLGVEGLRIVDASILPTPVSSYPNNVIVAVAEKAAHSINEQYAIYHF